MRSKTNSALGLVFFLGLCYFRLEVGSYVTATSVGTWYRTLNKAPFNPPDRAFTPVWIILYALMAIAGWRVWRHGNSRQVGIALGLFTIQLGLNFVWSVLFFGYQRVGLAFAEMLVLFLTVVAMTMLFFKIDRFAAILMMPYLLWLVFATVLTYYVLILN